MDNEIVRTKITNVIDFGTSIPKSEWGKNLYLYCR